MAEPKRSHDADVTAIVDRARALRVPQSELCKACGETAVTLWRWQYRDIATWKRRKAFLEAASNYLDAAQAGYTEA